MNEADVQLVHGTNGIAMLGLQEVTAPVISDVDRLEDNLDFMYAREESESASGAAGGGTAAREAEDSDNQCVACLSEEAGLMIVPCGHRCLCRNCGNRVMRMDPPRCPLCRTSIRGFNQVHAEQQASPAPTSSTASTSSVSGRVVPRYGADLSPRSRDERLEAAVNSTMDYLANEALVFEGLFKKRAPNISVHKTMVSIVSGVAIDFVELNDAPLACDVLHECLLQMSKPAYPYQLVDPLHEAFRASKSDPSEQQHKRMQAVLLEAVRLNAVSPMFLNLLGLLNLVVRNSKLNGCSLQVVAEKFASRMLAWPKAPASPDSQEFRLALSRAGAVMMELVEKVYVIFPPFPPTESQADAAAPPHHTPRSGDFECPSIPSS